MFAALFILWALTDSPTFRHCISERKNSEPYHQLHKDGGFFIKVVPRLQLNIACGFDSANENTGAITALSTILIALFTLALWISTDRLWRSGEKQIESIRISAQAAKASADAANLSVSLIPKFERAYLGFRIKIDGMPGRSVMKINFINNGKTPGIIKSIHICLLDREPPAIPDYSMGTTEIIGTVCSVGVDIDGPEYEIELKPIIYIFGYFVYEDIFRDKHTTWFCHFIEFDFQIRKTFSGLYGGDIYNRYD